jgi:ankyrin repeat protein
MAAYLTRFYNSVMKKLLLVLCANLVLILAPLFGEPQEWTNTQGKTIKAEFVSATNESVTLSMQGKVFVVKLADLSPASQALARKLSQPARPEANKPAGADGFLPLERLIAPDPAWVFSLNLGQILQKIDYAGLLNKPAVAHAYSLRGFFGDDFDTEEFLEEADRMRPGPLPFLTRLIEQPAETSGIDLDQPIHLSHRLPMQSGSLLDALFKMKPCLVLRLKDSARFEKFVREFCGVTLEENVPDWTIAGDGRRILRMFEMLAIVHDGSTAVLTMSDEAQTNAHFASEIFNRKDMPQPARLPQMLQEQLAQSHDFGGYFNLESLAILMEGESLPDFKGINAYFSFNSEPGKFVTDLTLDVGDKNAFKLDSDPVPEEILDILPASSFVQASLSVDLASSHEKLKPIYDLMELDPDEFKEGLKEEFGIDAGDIPELFSGQAAFGITGLDEEEEEVSFIAAIGTKVPAAEVYSRIIKEGLLRALHREGGGFDLLEHLSFAAKDQRLFISTKNHADILKAGRAEKTIGKEDRDALRNGFFNLALDLPAFPEDLINELDLEDFVGEGFIDRLQGFRLRVSQKGPSQLGVHFELQLTDKDAQALRTLAHLGVDYAYPRYSNAETRKKILEAVIPPVAIIGTWTGKLEDDHDLGGWSARSARTRQAHYKITLLKDGAKKWEDNRGRSLQTRWTLNGTTYKEYYKDILLYVATILAIDDQTMTFIDYMDISRKEISWETHTHKRSDPDHKLPELLEPEDEAPPTSGNSKPSEPLEAPTIPMQEAVARGDIESVRQHLDAGTDVNERNKVGWTPLHAASSRGRKEIVELLLDKGAQVNAQHDGGISPLGFAVARKHTETAELLRKHGGSIQSIYDAAIQGNLEFVRQRLDSGADVNGRNKAGGTLLHPAAVGGRTEIVKMLIDKGAQVNVKNNFGSTPLDLAVANQHTETAELLRKHGGLRSSEVAIDLDNPETRRQIVEQAIDYKQLRQSSEKLTVVPNPSGRGEIYSGWAKEMKSGRVGSLRRYKQGKKHGQEIFWLKNGQKRWEGTYKDGKLDGLSTLWHRNGQKGSETTYRDGVRISSKTWDEDGNPK